MTIRTVNFFDLSTNNDEPLRTDTEFGLCDDNEKPTEPAYSDNNQKNKDTEWIAIVENPNQRPIQFFALDNRIIRPQGQRICDGMLQVNEFDELHLVELKKVKSGWVQDAKDQLEQTTNFMSQFHKQELKKFRHKYAHACNKKRPSFEISNLGEKEKFRQETGFILKTQRKILIN